ncbi:MAG: SOS response-associated peptidase, partial [Pseudomonadota bacterium]|nr:SOS response-associated peptidase [Pseudomonadota bacterium]
RRRALLPADGFYEWERKSGQPYLIRQVDAQPFFMAAIWDVWAGPDGSEVEGCAVVTVEAAENLAHIHHRMPAMIAPADASDWLSAPEGDAPALQSLLTPADVGAFVDTPVSKRVNKRDAEGADLWQETEPVKAAEQLDLF